MKTYEEMAQSALSRIECCQIEKRKRRKTAALIALPVACVCLAAVLGLFVWRTDARRSELPITDSGSIALNDGAGHIPEIIDDLPEPDTPKAPSEKPAEQTFDTPKDMPEKPVETPPVQPSGTASAKPSDATSDAPSLKPAEPAPVSPDGTPAEPEGEMPPASEETPIGKPDEEIPEIFEEDPPVKPEDEPSAEPSGDAGDPTVEPPEEPEPQEDPQPYRPPQIGAAYRMEGERELITLTLLSTGEVEEFDVTGWRDQSHAHPSAEQPEQVYSQTSTYSTNCAAFGVIVICNLWVDENNEVHISTFTITLRQSEPQTPDENEPARAAQEAAEAAAREAQAERAAN